MNKRIIYAIPLLVLIVMWGLLGFAAASPAYAQPALQDTAVPTNPPPTVVVTTIVNTVIAPVATQLVPVTGTNNPGPNLMMLLFYGFLGLLAIVLLVALFASANRTVYVRRDGPPPPPDDL
jgi:hypothetical protein